MKKSVKGNVVLVTGGATGLGLKIADKFLENGAKLVIIVDINEQLGFKAVEDMNTKHGKEKAVFLKCDVTRDLNNTFETIISNYKGIDVLVNNAGVINEKSINQCINVNLIAVIEWSIKFYDFMRSDRGGNGGTIINISSIYGLKITPFAPCYNASKFGVVGFSKSIGHEYNFKRTNVRVVALCPGYCYTNLTANVVLREDDLLEDCFKLRQTFPWQSPDAVGKGAIEIFEKANSGTVWIVEGSQPAVEV